MSFMNKIFQNQVIELSKLMRDVSAMQTRMALKMRELDDRISKLESVDWLMREEKK